jgi:hypothetical protein
VGLGRLKTSNDKNLRICCPGAHLLRGPKLLKIIFQKNLGSSFDKKIKKYKWVNWVGRWARFWKVVWLLSTTLPTLCKQVIKKFLLILLI